MLTPTELKVLDALNEPMTVERVANKFGYRKDTARTFIKKLLETGCVEHDGFEGRSKVFRATGKKPSEPKTLGFTVFGVRI